MTQMVKGTITASTWPPSLSATELVLLNVAQYATMKHLALNGLKEASCDPTRHNDVYDVAFACKSVKAAPWSAGGAPHSHGKLK
mmetsp:Transcript_69450/g.196064  ORF Transcript_69450/g.196064 Transcript_69450/m.196064 type:complete len:84 (+) Transcript_69450:53-304(+)